MSTVVPNYEKTLCQHCSGHIEFDAARMASPELVIECPHCHSYTTIVAPPRLPALPPPIPPKEVRRATSQRTLAIVISLVAAVSILLLIGSFLAVQHGPPSPPSDYDAYSTAVNYIKTVYPHAQCSSFSESSVMREGPNYTVSVMIYGVNTVKYGVITRMWVSMSYGGRRFEVLYARQS